MFDPAEIVLKLSIISPVAVILFFIVLDNEDTSVLKMKYKNTMALSQKTTREQQSS